MSSALQGAATRETLDAGAALWLGRAESELKLIFDASGEKFIGRSHQIRQVKVNAKRKVNSRAKVDADQAAWRWLADRVTEWRHPQRRAPEAM